MYKNPKDYRMPQEKPLSWYDFHDLLTMRIREAHPGRTTLKVKEIAKMEGRDPRTIRKRYQFDADGDIAIDDYIRERYRRSRNKA